MKVLARGLVKLAIWLVKHPDVVEHIVKDVAAVKAAARKDKDRP